MTNHPNVVFIFTDEMRAQATGYAGDPNVNTPTLDKLYSQSFNFPNAVSGCPVCSPYRASLMTGQYPHTHGVYINDVELDPQCESIARVFKSQGYDTAYIGKWHIHGSPGGTYDRRKTYVPRDCQLGFDYWKGFECSHDYNSSDYFFNDDPTPRKWEGYDAFAQSLDAANYISEHADSDRPFMLMLSYGPPHFPLHTAPEKYRRRLADREIKLRPNVAPELVEEETECLRGYYAHIEAIDDALKTVLASIEKNDLTDSTIVVFTSDHGDMRGSQGYHTKQVPHAESLHVPFLLRHPELQGGMDVPFPIDAPDIMPTLCGLCGLPPPTNAEGRDCSGFLTGTEEPADTHAALLNMLSAFAAGRRVGLRPYRGLRTARYTYVRNIDGPWLLFDHRNDPHQLHNLINSTAHTDLQAELETALQARLAEIGDQFLPGHHYLERDKLTHYREVNLPVGTKVPCPWD